MVRRGLMQVPLVMLLSIVLSTLSDLTRATEPVRIDIQRDVWISAYSGEQEGNNGAAPRLKLKGIQEFFLVDFDATPYQGKTINRAELRIKSASNDPALRITVSTVQTEWQEGTGTNYSKDTQGCSFLWAEAGKKPWGGDGRDVTSVTLGNGGSRWSFGDATPPDADGWQRIPVAPDVLQAKLDKKCFGFLIMDDVGSEYQRIDDRFEYRLMPNRFFYSRDQNRASAPYFVVWFDDNNATPTKSQNPTIASNTSPEPNKAIASATPSGSRSQPDLTEFANFLRTILTTPQPQSTTPGTLEVLNIDGKQKSKTKLGMARGETITKLIDAPADSLQIVAPSGITVTTFSLPKIENQWDPAIPSQLGIPQSIGLPPNLPLATAIDLYAEKSIKPGDYKIEIKYADKSTILEIRIWDFNLPDHLSFIPQMNCYGLPPMERSYYQLCHDHRTTLNSLRYGWTGKVSQDAVPKKKTDGNWDWTNWDQQWGPLLDGSAFENSKRGPIPIEAFYLPINENWPMDHEKHFRGGYWIETAYGDDYWNQFNAITREFAIHLKEKNYRDTLFEFYLNNKVYFKQQRGGRWDGCSAPWVFDEPVNTQDFWALRKFGIEFWNAVESVPGPRFGFRVDISRPEWQRELLDGISSVEVVSGALRQYQTRIINRAEKYDNLVYMYGSANTFDQSNQTNVAWCVETWARGADGVVPWQTMGTNESWKKLDPLSVIYPTELGAVPSLRLKSFRDGQQLVEYLEAFRRSTNLPRQEMGNMLLEDFGLSGKTVKRSEEDAGSVRFGTEELEKLEALRWALGEYLDKYPPASTPVPAISKARNRLQLENNRTSLPAPATE